MKTTAIAALTLLTLAGAASADVRETQTFAGPYGTYGPLANPLNTTVTATFTGTDAGTPYNANGLLIVLDMASQIAATYAQEVGIRVTPPSGTAFTVFPSGQLTYTTITDATVDIPIPAGINPVGTWTFTFYETYYDGGVGGDSSLTNVRISLQDLPPVTPPTATDLGTLGSTPITSTVENYNGVDPVWFKITLPQDASDASGFYVDLTTDGTSIGPGASETANDTMMGVYDAAGLLYAVNDDFDYPTDPWSSLSFGASTAVARDHTGYTDGFDGDLTAGSYYVAVSPYLTDFGDTNFEVTSQSTSPGGTLVLNVFSNFPGGPARCSPADVGAAGGVAGQDNRLDNNDFIAFITLFFNQDPQADVGAAGGVPGQDSTWDNNDFIAFISYFFNDQAACTG